MTNQTKRRYIIAKSAGDDFSFTTQLVTEPELVGYQPEYAERLALEVTAAMKAVRTLPLLLEALKMCIKQYEDVRDNQPTGHLWPDPNHIYYARAAIAAVEGEAPYTLCQRLLESLTPQGSEFHNDPLRCAEWISEKLASRAKLAGERNRMRDALQNLVDANDFNYSVQAMRDEGYFDNARATIASTTGETHV